MGTWGLGPFENDTALDWVWELQEGGLEVLAGTLRRAAESDPNEYLEAPDGDEAVAAAAVVAAARAGDEIAVPDEVAAWLAEHRGGIDDTFADAARSALDRVVAPNSELRELFEEAGEADWISRVTALRAQLA